MYCIIKVYINYTTSYIILILTFYNMIQLYQVGLWATWQLDSCILGDKHETSRRQ